MTELEGRLFMIRRALEESTKVHDKNICLFFSNRTLSKALKISLLCCGCVCYGTNIDLHRKSNVKEEEVEVGESS